MTGAFFCLAGIRRFVWRDACGYAIAGDLESVAELWESNCKMRGREARSKGTE